MKSLFCIGLLVATGLATILEGPEFFGRSEYYLLETSTWEEAEAEAHTMGWHLVTINTEAENTWVINTFSPDNSRNLWIGFTDQVVEGEFEWVSGQIITYTNWGMGNPDDQCGGQDYAYIVGDIVPLNGPSYRGEWDDCDNDGYMPSNTYYGVVEIDYVTLSRGSWASIKRSF